MEVMCKVILFTILEIILVHSAAISKKEEVAHWRKHNTRSAKFMCSVPQPRALSYKDFIDVTTLPSINSDVLPMMTVLHRCDSQTGCCTRKDEACTRKEYKNVTLTFQIVTIMPDNKIDRYYESVIVQNHTKCECELQRNKPK